MEHLLVIPGIELQSILEHQMNLIQPLLGVLASILLTKRKFNRISWMMHVRKLANICIMVFMGTFYIIHVLITLEFINKERFKKKRENFKFSNIFDIKHNMHQ